MSSIEFRIYFAKLFYIYYAPGPGYFYAPFFAKSYLFSFPNLVPYLLFTTLSGLLILYFTKSSVFKFYYIVPGQVFASFFVFLPMLNAKELF